MTKVQEYCEARAINIYYRSQRMKTGVRTKKAKEENDRLFDKAMEYKRVCDRIEEEEEGNDQFWGDVDDYSKHHAVRLMTAGKTFNLK